MQATSRMFLCARCWVQVLSVVVATADNAIAPSNAHAYRAARTSAKPADATTTTLLRLLDRYGTAGLQVAVEDALRAGSPHTNTVRAALERRRTARGAPTPVGTSNGRGPNASRWRWKPWWSWFAAVFSIPLTLSIPSRLFPGRFIMHHASFPCPDNGAGSPMNAYLRVDPRYMITDRIA